MSDEDLMDYPRFKKRVTGAKKLSTLSINDIKPKMVSCKDEVISGEWDHYCDKLAMEHLMSLQKADHKSRLVNVPKACPQTPSCCPFMNISVDKHVSHVLAGIFIGVIGIYIFSAAPPVRLVI